MCLNLLNYLDPCPRTIMRSRMEGVNERETEREEERESVLKGKVGGRIIGLNRYLSHLDFTFKTHLSQGSALGFSRLCLYFGAGHPTKWDHQTWCSIPVIYLGYAHSATHPSYVASTPKSIFCIYLLAYDSANEWCMGSCFFIRPFFWDLSNVLTGRIVREILPRTELLWLLCNKNSNFHRDQSPKAWIKHFSIFFCVPNAPLLCPISSIMWTTCKSIGLCLLVAW